MQQSTYHRLTEFLAEQRLSEETQLIYKAAETLVARDETSSQALGQALLLRVVEQCGFLKQVRHTLPECEAIKPFDLDRFHTLWDATHERLTQIRQYRNTAICNTILVLSGGFLVVTELSLGMGGIALTLTLGLIGTAAITLTCWMVGAIVGGIALVVGLGIGIRFLSDIIKSLNQEITQEKHKMTAQLCEEITNEAPFSVAQNDEPIPLKSGFKSRF